MDHNEKGHAIPIMHKVWEEHGHCLFKPNTDDDEVDADAVRAFMKEHLDREKPLSIKFHKKHWTTISDEEKVDLFTAAFPEPQYRTPK